ncbi:hypothetical protein TNCV_4692391 [Trichonephila clavipes]|nr:hypothetical protein TNCV_4692391 [Trichonephila clavipes]
MKATTLQSMVIGLRVKIYSKILPSHYY